MAFAEKSQVGKQVGRRCFEDQENIHPGGSGVAIGEESLFLRGFDSSIALIEEGANSRFGGGMRLTGPTRHAVKTSRQIPSVSGCGYSNGCAGKKVVENTAETEGSHAESVYRR